MQEAQSRSKRKLLSDPSMTVKVGQSKGKHLAPFIVVEAASHGSEATVTVTTIVRKLKSDKNKMYKKLCNLN
jgi:hypothetical protein